MRSHIRSKIEQALANGGDNSPVNARTIGTASSAAKYNYAIIVDQVLEDTRSWTVKEIAIRHNVSYWTVYRALKQTWLVAFRKNHSSFGFSISKLDRINDRQRHYVLTTVSLVLRSARRFSADLNMASSSTFAASTCSATQNLA